MDEIPVHDEFVPEALFSSFLEHMPQVCVELVFEAEVGILLAKRTIEPRIWFWPGGRLYKGEQLEEAAHRFAREELGLEITIVDQLGPYSHFWPESPAEGSPSRHTVNHVFYVTPATEEFEITLDDQHSAYRFITDLEPELHEYVQLYLTDNQLV